MKRKNFKAIFLGFVLNIPFGFVLWFILWYGKLGALGFSIMIALILNGYLLAWFWRSLAINVLQKSVLGWFSMILNHFLFFGTELFIFRKEVISFDFIAYFIGVVIFYYPFCWLGFVIFDKVQKRSAKQFISKES